MYLQQLHSHNHFRISGAKASSLCRYNDDNGVLHALSVSYSCLWRDYFHSHWSNQISTCSNFWYSPLTKISCSQTAQILVPTLTHLYNVRCKAIFLGFYINTSGLHYIIHAGLLSSLLNWQALTKLRNAMLFYSDFNSHWWQDC